MYTPGYHSEEYLDLIFFQVLSQRKKPDYLTILKIKYLVKTSTRIIKPLLGLIRQILVA
jgi:hypothetical protein